ncbi:DNA-binding transcriptional LysR family regulator [Sphingomonas zeicaulis]|uniref:LysR family transcriptional regulator n=1 Tax=Sphingomonas zeicaulis TaxID=1632740 RepID=UPI003D230144
MQAMHEKPGDQLDQITTFAAVVEHGGFAAAARILGKDPSVLSRRVDALERRLGVRLLARTTRKVGLTEVGAAYLQKIRVVLAELAAADVEAAEGAARPRGLLRVTMPRTFARLWVVPWLPDFLREYPEIELELELGNRFFDLVEEKLDLAIRLGGLAESSLIVRHLASFETVLCASPAYLEEAGTPHTLDELQYHRCLGLTVPNFWPDWRLRRGEERVTVQVPCQFRTDDGSSMVHAALCGGGIMLSSEWSCGRHLAEGRLVRVLPDWKMDHDGNAQVVLPPGRLVPAKTRAFIERLVAEFSPLAPWAR